MFYYHDEENRKVFKSEEELDLPDLKVVGQFEYMVLEAKYEEENTIEIELRWYQEECPQILYNDCVNQGFSPIAAIPTGAGKSIIICEFINVYLTNLPQNKVLAVSHVSDILEQNFNALENYFDGLDIGLYSAGLGVREQEKITVAGIQSIYKKFEEFYHYDCLVIDECHLMNNQDSGMYRNFIEWVNRKRRTENLKPLHIVGLTATPYRTGQGYIHEGDDSIFNALSYNLCTPKKFQKLIDDGYLSLIVTKATNYEMDADDIKESGGDFNTGDLGAKFDREEITQTICKEIIKFKKKYKKWLIFCIDIHHAERTSKILNELGVSCETVHSKMDNSKSSIMNKFKSGEIQALTNVNMLTTGIDVPDIDLIILMRPTKSPVLHVQTIGRGLRVADSKTHCLVLDFAGNTRRIGPIDDIQVNKVRKGKDGSPMVRECPDCGVLNHISKKECISCGYEFPVANKLSAKADAAPMFSKDIDNFDKVTMPVDNIVYKRYKKHGMPDSVKVSYYRGFNCIVEEWICPGHAQISKFAKRKADKWWGRRNQMNIVVPNNATDFLKNALELSRPCAVSFQKKGNFFEITDHHFDTGKNVKARIYDNDSENGDSDWGRAGREAAESFIRFGKVMSNLKTKIDTGWPEDDDIPF